MYALSDQARYPIVPTQSDALIAREALPRLKPIAEAGADIRIRVLESADVTVPLPAVAVQMIVRLLETINNGRPVSVIPSDAELTTQQAADMLNVSRPHPVELLNEGQIPFGKVGTHRPAADHAPVRASRHTFKSSTMRRSLDGPNSVPTRRALPRRPRSPPWPRSSSVRPVRRLSRFSAALSAGLRPAAEEPNEFLPQQCPHDRQHRPFLASPLETAK